MIIEYNLHYTADEINKKLKKIPDETENDNYTIITSKNIKSVLGYTPASEESVESLKTLLGDNISQLEKIVYGE